MSKVKFLNNNDMNGIIALPVSESSISNKIKKMSELAVNGTLSSRDLHTDKSSTPV